MHLNRSPALSGRSKIAHQIDFARVARSILIIGHVEDDEAHERVIWHDKHNYTEKQPAKRAYIRTVEVPVGGSPVSQPVLEIDGDSDTAVEDMLVGEVDPQARAKAIKASRARYLELASALDEAWREMGKPSTAAASDFRQVTATYSSDTVTRPSGGCKSRSAARTLRGPGTWATTGTSPLPAWKPREQM